MMKVDATPGILKTLVMSQDEKTRGVVDLAISNATKEIRERASAKVTKALEAFTQAKNDHADNMNRLKDIDAQISRNEEERKTVLEESVKAQDSWRTRFRQLRGAMTPEMKAEHSQQIAYRELAEEFSTLITQLEAEKEETMTNASYSGNRYISAHRDAFSAYAENEWAVALLSLPAELIRAFRLRLRALQINGAERPRQTMTEEFGEYLLSMSACYPFDMNKEPVVSQLGLNRPELPGVDMEKYRTPAQQHAHLNKLKTGG